MFWSIEILFFRFLIPQILRKYGQNDIAGAFILDTVLNFNSSAHSQEINEDMESLVDLAEAIAKNDHRGDFINMWKRSFYDDALADTFRRHWNKEPSQFRLLDATLEFESQVPSAQMMEEKISYFRSDHSRFWIVNQPDFASFKAVLLTDTGINRLFLKLTNLLNIHDFRSLQRFDEEMLSSPL